MVLFNSDASLFILCPSDLSVGDRGVLKSSTVTDLGLICVLQSCSTVFTKLGVAEVGPYMFIIVMSSWSIVALIRMK